MSSPSSSSSIPLPVGSSITYCETPSDDPHFTLADHQQHYIDFDWYTEPEYYDIIFDMDTQVEANGMEKCMQAAKQCTHTACDNTPYIPRLLEPACGTGRLMIELFRRGYSCVGFDRVKETLEFAQKRFDEITTVRPLHSQTETGTDEVKQSNTEQCCTSKPFYSLLHADMLGFRQQCPQIEQSNYIHSNDLFTIVSAQ